jgi:hypothetical protein
MSTVKRTASRQEVLKSLSHFSNLLADHDSFDPSQSLVLKLPIAGLLLPEICHIFDTKLIICMRPLMSIEQSRLRRQWPSQFGMVGAEKIYSTLFTHIINTNVDFLLIRYEDIIAKTSESISSLVSFCELNPSTSQLQKAFSMITRDSQFEEIGIQN